MTPSLFIILFVGTWPVAGIAAAGFANAYIQREFPEVRSDSDLRFALLGGIICGWGALIIEIVNILTPWRSRHGWSLRRDAVSGWEPR